MAHFHFRGPLPLGSKLFVGRQAQLRQVRELCAGPLRSYITLIGARQTGKTSFLYRLRGALKPHAQSVLINLQMISDATSSELFQFMSIQLVKQLDFPALRPLAEQISSGTGFEKLLRELPYAARNVAVLVDEIGALPENTAISMANVLRAVFNDRMLPGFEALGRFVFLLAGGNELLYLTVTEVSPFSNIATKVFLPDLSPGETKQLIAYGFAGTDMEVGLLQEIAEAVYEHTHGHPYLSQRVGAYISSFMAEEHTNPDPSWVTRAREAMMTTDENIRYVRGALRDPALLDIAFGTMQRSTPFQYLSMLQEKLYLLGIIRNENGVAVPRNAMYAEVIRQLADELGTARVEAPTRSAATRVSVGLLTTVVPTAFCHNLTAKDFPLVQISIDNSDKSSPVAQIYATARIEGFSDMTVSSVQVPAGERSEMSLLPLLQFEPVRTLNEIRPATLHVQVRQFGQGAELWLHDQTYPIKLHAHDTALLGIRTPEGRIIDLTDYLVAFVTPHAPEVEDLLRRAADYHPRHQIPGYQGATDLDEARRIVREQIQAIYTALKRDAGLLYINSPLNFGKQEGQITQRVRLPATSLHEDRSRANCIDGAVLYASLLELATLEPLIVIVPGHAFIGWRIWRGIDQYDFLETTLTGTEDPEKALEMGKQQYEQARAKGFFGRELFDPKGFARLIDVAACRRRDINPLG
jgi:hypothetical protein